MDDWHVNIGRMFNDGDPRPCEQCGKPTRLVINRYAYCPKHVEAGIRTVVRVEALRVDAPPDVVEEATKWLMKTVRESNASMQ